jgi:hypothetical protein
MELHWGFRHFYGVLYPKQSFIFPYIYVSILKYAIIVPTHARSVKHNLCCGVVLEVLRAESLSVYQASKALHQ